METITHEIKKVAGYWTEYQLQLEKGIKNFFAGFLLLAVCLGVLCVTKHPLQDIESVFPVLLGILGLCILVPGFKHVTAWKAAKRAYDGSPPHYVNTIIKTFENVENADPDTDENSFTFKTVVRTGKSSTMYLWKGIFDEEKVVVVRLPRTEIYFLKKKGFEIKANDSLQDSDLEAVFSVPSGNHKGTIPRRDFDKYKKWKNQDETPNEI